MKNNSDVTYYSIELKGSDNYLPRNEDGLSTLPKLF